MSALATSILDKKAGEEEKEEEKWSITPVAGCRVREECKCVSCTHIPRHPMETECGQIVCFTCKCSCKPACLATTVTPKGKLYGLLFSSLVVHCPWCDFTPTYRFLQPHADECESRPQTCKLCLAKCTRGTIAVHKTKECPNRTVECPDCKESLAAKNLSEHTNQVCDKALVECATFVGDTADGERKGCGERVVRSKLAQHQSQDCVERKVDCPLATSGCGCSWSGKSRDLPQHLLSALGKHLPVLAALVSRVGALEKEVSVLRQSLVECKAVRPSVNSGALESKIDASAKLNENLSLQACDMAMVASDTPVTADTTVAYFSNEWGIWRVNFDGSFEHILSNQTSPDDRWAPCSRLVRSGQNLYVANGREVRRFSLGKPGMGVRVVVAESTDHVFAVLPSGRLLVAGRKHGWTCNVKTGKVESVSYTNKALDLQASAVATCNQKVYVFGGTNTWSTSGAQVCCQVFEEDKGEWSNIADAPAPLCNGAACVVDDEIWVVGASVKTPLAIFIYNVQSNTWRLSRVTLPRGFFGPGVTYHEPSKTMFLFGGRSVYTLSNPRLEEHSKWVAHHSEEEIGRFIGYCA